MKCLINADFPFEKKLNRHQQICIVTIVTVRGIYISILIFVLILNCSGGSRISRRGSADSRGSYVSKILYIEMKESGPLGGRAPGTPP